MREKNLLHKDIKSVASGFLSTFSGIKSEIDRLSSNHEEANINLINNVLRPMLLFIDDHNKIMAEISRIGGKHSL